MKTLVCALWLIPSLIWAESPKAHSWDASLTIFKILSKSLNKNSKPTSPTTIEVQKINCAVSGTKDKPQASCKGLFRVDGKLQEMSIADSSKFFSYLTANNAIILKDFGFGASTYGAEILICTYDTSKTTFHTCISNISVHF